MVNAPEFRRHESRVPILRRNLVRDQRGTVRRRSLGLSRAARPGRSARL